MKKFVLILIIFLLAGNLEAGTIDSLETLLKTANLSNKPSLLIQLSKATLAKQPDKSKEYAIEAINISKKLKDSANLAIAYLRLGHYHYYYGSSPKAISNYLECINLNNHLNQANLASAYTNLGILNKNKGQYEKSLEYNSKALKIRQAEKDSTGIAKSLNNIGTVYYYMNNLDKALEYYEKSLNLKIALGDSLTLGNSYNNVGMIYSDMGKPRQALKYYEKSLELDKKLGSESGISTSLNNIGNVYYDLKDFEKAIEYYQKAYNIDKKVNHKFGETLSIINIGCAYKELNVFDKAISYLSKGLEMADQNNFKDIQKEGYYILSDIYSDKGEYRKALDAYKKYSVVKDSIYNENLQNKIAEINAQLRESRIEQENKLLKIEKENSEKESEIRALELYKQKFWKNVLIVGSIVFIFIAIILFMRYRSRLKASELLEKKNKEIMAKKNELEKSQKEAQQESQKLQDLNEKLSNSEQNLRELNITKDKFFSIVAHDLYNPITALITSTELMTLYFDKLDEEKILGHIEKLGIASKNLKNLLDNLLQWSRAQTGRISYEPEKVDLNMIVKNCINLLSATAKHKKIEIISEVPQNYYVYADKNMVTTMVRNLISNAIKFSYNDNKIEVFSSQENGMTKVSVKDYGVGISEEDKSKIFKLDSQHTTKGTQKETGTGLGLVLCKEFAKKHGSVIEVDSKLNEGSVFSFSLPLVK